MHQTTTKGENYMGILIRGGRIVDAATDTDKKGDIYLEDGVFKHTGRDLFDLVLLFMRYCPARCFWGMNMPKSRYI